MTIESRVGMPLDEFSDLYRHLPFELINGEKKLLIPHTAESSEVIKYLYLALANYEQTYKTVVAYSLSPFVQVDTPDWIKSASTPDILLYAIGRMEAYKN